LLIIVMDEAETSLEARGLGRLNLNAGRGRDSDVDSSHTGGRDVEQQRRENLNQLTLYRGSALRGFNLSHSKLSFELPYLKMR
jgi:hypothetical protein